MLCDAEPNPPVLPWNAMTTTTGSQDSDDSPNGGPPKPWFESVREYSDRLLSNLHLPSLSNDEKRSNASTDYDRLSVDFSAASGGSVTLSRRDSLDATDADSAAAHCKQVFMEVEEEALLALQNNNSYPNPECGRKCSTERMYFASGCNGGSYDGDAGVITAAADMDISTGHAVLAYMEDHVLHSDRLGCEWDALCGYEAELGSTTEALLPRNLRKNRSLDILPFNHKRVILDKNINVSDADYINATAITDHDPRRPTYIVTQGPLPHTVADFWQMVWEQECVVIVNLTSLVEDDVTKCHQYWPMKGCDQYHNYEIHLVSEHVWGEDCIVRSFFLKNVRTGGSRTITQYHYLDWPEAGLPRSTCGLLNFRRKVNRSYRGQSCPIVVHCSDGAGRTGTYCLIDTVLSRLAKGAKEIDIAATLEHFRDQHGKMVRTKEQFEFTLSAVAEEVEHSLRMLRN